MDAFIQNYVDLTPDPTLAYAPYPSASMENYQHLPFTQNVETTEGYLCTEQPETKRQGGCLGREGAPLPWTSLKVCCPEL